MSHYKKESLNTIVFDFDGTLARLNIDFAHMRQCIVDLISSFHVSLEHLEDLFALEMVEAGRTLIANRSPAQAETFLHRAHHLIWDIEMDGARKGELFEGIEDMLTQLRKRNIKTGVVTRNCFEAVTWLYPDIESACDVVITREATKNVKPHPEHLAIALEALEATPELAAMVGDHPMDITVGKDVGTFTIGVLTGYAHEELLREAGADIILNRATDLTELI